MKLIFALSIVAFSFAFANAQSATPTPEQPRCALKPADAPAIRGIKLGMALEKILEMFRKTKDDPSVAGSIADEEKRFGVIQFSPSLPSADPKFSGVSYFNFTFFDRKLVEIYISYEPVPWRNVDEFLNRFIETYRLPAIGSWKIEGDSASLNNPGCDDFHIFASISNRGDGSQGIFRVIDGSYVKTVRARAETLREKARQAFKP
jgi:hypothetical protein